MAIKWKVLKSDSFKTLQLESGVLLNKYDITGVTPFNADTDMVTATTGGIKVTYNRPTKNLAADIDQAYDNLADYTVYDVGEEALIEVTALETSPEVIAMALGSATVTTEDGVTKILPKNDLEMSDFKDIWHVCDIAGGGELAICLKNGLSNDGFSLQTEKNANGQYALSFKGYRTIATQDKPPIEFYIKEEVTP